MDEVIPYPLLDPESGLEWRIPLTKAESLVYDLDHMRRFRKIRELKAANAPPFARWADANSSSILPSRPSASVGGSDVTGASAASTRAKGPTGATWKGNVPTSLLNCSLGFRKWLRLNPVPETVFQQISDGLYAIGIDRSWEQIRAKFKTLKRAFSEAKKGKHNGDQWPHYWLMSYIYDETIIDGDTTLAPPGFEIELLDSADAAGTPLFSSTIVSSADAAGELDNPIHPNPGAGGEWEDIETSVTFGDNSSEALANNGLIVNIEKSFNTEDLNDNGSHGVDTEDYNNNVTKTQEVNTEDSNNNEYDLEIIKSPSKKKSKHVTKGSCSALNSPRKTPTKRKLPKYLLHLKESDTVKLVDQFILKKDSLQKKSIPSQVWKDMSNALGGDFTWQICREKFCQMDNTFKTTFLPLGGVMGGVKWPYYENFCKLYEIPEDYYQIVMNASSDGGDDDEQAGETEDHNGLWNRKALLLLLSLYKTNKTKFEGSDSSLRHNYLYARLAGGMKEKGYDHTWKQCKSKMGRMKDKLRIEFDKCNKTGASPSTWEYYETMLEMFDGAAWLVAPVAVSVGRGLQYTVDGETKENLREGTRTRPSLPSKKKTESKNEPKKPIYRNWAQEQSILHKAELVKQMDRLNAQVEDNAKHRNAFYQAFANKYLKPDN